MKKISILLIAFIAVVFISCKKETTTQTVTLPSTYNFDNVDFSEQTTLLSMLTAIGVEMRKGLTQDLSGATLFNMYSNTANPFSNDTLNFSGAQLREETYADDIPVFDSYFQNLAAVSTLRANLVTGGGMAGTAISVIDNTKKYLVDSNGVEYAQLIQKGLMGAVFYYRISQDETAKSTLDASDNTTVTPGSGTHMQHEWDEAFGYWGVPVTLTASNFDSLNTAKKVYFYGNYVSKGEDIGLVGKLLTAYIKGRDAIGRKDYATRDAAAADVRKDFELINACGYISYLNQAVAASGDYATFCHTMSEGFGFFNALKYNSGKKISQTDFDDILSKYYVGGKLSFAHFTSLELISIRDRLSTIYGLDSIKNTL